MNWTRTSAYDRHEDWRPRTRLLPAACFHSFIAAYQMDHPSRFIDRKAHNIGRINGRLFAFFEIVGAPLSCRMLRVRKFSASVPCGPSARRDTYRADRSPNYAGWRLAS